MAAVPALASAATVFVGTEPVKGPFNSCASPGYKGIQEAVTANPAKTTIHVCAGEYKEQVRIEKAETVNGDAGSTLKLPASPTNTTTSCDVAEEQDQVAVCGAGKVTITGLTLDSKWTEVNCGKRFYGILVGGSSQLTLTNATILHAGFDPLEGAGGGCQQGVALQIGHNINGQVGTAKLTGDLIEGYQKNGITIDGPGSKAKISGVTVQSEPSGVIARNGIQIGRGAAAKISGSTVTGNECNAGACGPDAQTQTQSAGVLIFEQAPGVSVKSSNISKNDMGVYNATGSESVSTSIFGNTLEENRYEGIVLEEGAAKVNNNNIVGNGKANVGIQVLQFEEDKVGVKATGKSDTISGMTKCAVEGSSDIKAGDKLDNLSLKTSVGKFSGNAQPLCNNNEAKIIISLT